MKRILVALMALLCLNQMSAQDAKILVRGLVKDTICVTTYRYIPNKADAFNEYVFEAVNNSENIILIPERVCDERIYFSCNKGFTLLEVKRGQTIVVNVNDASMNFSGENAEVNNYLYKWVQNDIASFSNLLSFRLGIKNYYNKSFYNFPEQLDSDQALNKLSKLSKEGLKELKKQKIKDKAFVNRQEVWVKNLALQIGLENYKYSLLKNIQLSKAFFNLFKDWVFDDVRILNHPEGIRLMEDFFEMEEQEFGVKRIVPNRLAMRAASVKDPVLKEHYVLHELNTSLKAGISFMIADIYKNVEPFITSTTGLEEYKALKARVDEVDKMNMTGIEALDFNYENDKGERVKLSDFKGQYVFIDLWATWCGPCVFEIPYLKKLEEELHGKNISFVTISFDEQKNKNRWKQFLHANHMEGVQLITNKGNNNALKDYYSIHGIPRFLLVDPNGKIISANCLRPSNTGLVSYLKSVL